MILLFAHSEHRFDLIRVPKADIGHTYASEISHMKKKET